MTIPKGRNGWAARITVGLSALILLVSAVAFAVNAANKAGAACEQAADHEARLRAIETTQQNMAGDIRVIRVLLEQEMKRKERP